MTKNTASSSRSLLALAGFILFTFCAPALAVFFPMPGAWYAALHKPAWTPPPWLFGPAWTLLYLLMATAAWLVWKKAGFTGAIGLWVVQLVLNALWTPLFFGAHLLGIALMEIVLLWFAILLTSLAFRRINATAGWLMAPYLLWVTFATALNFELWRLNGG